MDLNVAAAKADAILNLIITNQPTFVPSGATSTPERAEALAKAIAHLRKTLMQEIQKQEH